MGTSGPASFKATVIGGVASLIGSIGFIVIIVAVYFAEPERSFGNLASLHVVGIVACLVLVSLGRYIGWKYGHGFPGTSIIGAGNMMNPLSRGPKRSTLEDLGYHIPPDVSEGEDRWVLTDEGELRVICPYCGTENEPEFTFCGDCSARLPEDEEA